MADKEHISILVNSITGSGAEAWNTWRRENPDIIPDFSDGKFIGAVSANLRDVDFSAANLTRARFDIADLSNANLRGAVITDGDLNQANLTGAILSDASLIRAQLMGTNFKNAVIVGANFSLARLRNSNLINSDLTRSDLSGADLSDCDLTNAKLERAFVSGANLSSANLTQANLYRAILTGANLFDVDLKGADLSEAEIGYTLFVNNDLSFVKGLESVIHNLPSPIGIDTIYKSKGNISELFLRGAGVPDNFIAYMHSLTAKAVEFYSCFISYSSKNHDFAERLYKDLKAVGVRSWFAPEDLKIGESIRVGIDESIRLHDKLLLVLSSSSVKSQWVEREVETGLEKEQEQKRIIVYPIMLDNAVMTSKRPWAVALRTSRHIGDFRQWMNQSLYKKALSRLVRDLRAEESQG